MRVLSYAALAVCFASPAFAKTITLAPIIDIGFRAEIPEDGIAYEANCLSEYDGEVLPAGGTIGTMPAEFFADDRRANYEFDVRPIGKVISATLLFSALEVEGGGESRNCVLGYTGNGIGDLDDYRPIDRQIISYFDLLEDPISGGALLFEGAIDITAYLRELIRNGGDFAGIQFANDDNSDNVNDLFDVRLIVETIPEPATLALFGLGLAGLATMRRRRAA